MIKNITEDVLVAVLGKHAAARWICPS